MSTVFQPSNLPPTGNSFTDVINTSDSIQYFENLISALPTNRDSPCYGGSSQSLKLLAQFLQAVQNGQPSFVDPSTGKTMYITPAVKASIQNAMPNFNNYFNQFVPTYFAPPKMYSVCDANGNAVSTLDFLTAAPNTQFYYMSNGTLLPCNIYSLMLTPNPESNDNDYKNALNNINNILY